MDDAYNVYIMFTCTDRWTFRPDETPYDEPGRTRFDHFGVQFPQHPIPWKKETRIDRKDSFRNRASLHRVFMQKND